MIWNLISIFVGFAAGILWTRWAVRRMISRAEFRPSVKPEPQAPTKLRQRTRAGGDTGHARVREVHVRQPRSNNPDR